MAKLTGMGVMTVDYRTTSSLPKPTSFPEDLVGNSTEIPPPIHFPLSCASTRRHQSQLTHFGVVLRRLRQADVVQGLQWLKAKGATELFLFGDSSGGTQVGSPPPPPASHRFGPPSIDLRGLQPA